MQDPNGGRTTYAYDAARRLGHLVNPLLERTTYSYDSAGQMLSQKLANTTRQLHLRRGGAGHLLAKPDI